MIIVAIAADIEALIQKYSTEYVLDPSLVAAICMQESGFETWRSRFEPNWTYLYFPLNYATKLAITFDSENNMQKTSWGLAQIMGSVARELGFDDYLQKLSLPENGLLYACKKLSQLKLRHQNMNDVISSYNQGSPVKDLATGNYKNQAYVDHVLAYRTSYAYLCQ